MLVYINDVSLKWNDIIFLGVGVKFNDLGGNYRCKCGLNVIYCFIMYLLCVRYWVVFFFCINRLYICEVIVIIMLYTRK